MICAYFLRLFLALTLAALTLAGCTPQNRPNPSLLEQKHASGLAAEARGILKGISTGNPELARELGRLPELQKAVGPRELAALKNLQNYYALDRAGFDRAFAIMNRVGLFQHRKYCTPLQAVFWLSREYEFRPGRNPLAAYSLKKLLDEAWRFEARAAPAEVALLVEAIQATALKAEYLELLEQGEAKKALNYLKIDVKRKESAFPEGFEERLKALSGNPRWDDYELVMARLNDPRLVDYYVRSQISYANWWTIPQYEAEGYDPRYVFEHKSGDCLYISNFITEALSLNGYRAYTEKMPPTRAGDEFHAVTVYELNGGKFIIDDGRVLKAGIMPYADY